MAKTAKNGKQAVLGLDIGSNSIGWALLSEDRGEKSLVDVGVRVFEAGVDDDIESGRDVSRAVHRREARLHRRQLRRRNRRLKKLAATLQQYSLFPQGDVSTAENLKNLIDSLDAGLAGDAPDPAMLPYFLRARALDEKLRPQETGRAIYHLAHRRGYRSNRKVQQKESEEESKVVLGAISELEKKMREAGARTLGEYLSKIDPAEDRIRNRYISRQMVRDEFDAIWEAQAKHHPDIMTDEAREDIRHAIFFQLPLKSNRGTIGRCELTGRRRAPAALLVSQRFRMLQKINDLRVILPDGTSRPVTGKDRMAIIDSLETTGSRKFTAIRKELRIKGKFNFEESEKEIIGNRTAARIARAIGKEKYDSLSTEERDGIVGLMRSTRKEGALKKALVNKFGLDEGSASKLAGSALEEGYMSLSQSAMKKLLPLMEKGVQYATAVKKVYGDLKPAETFDELPPLAFSPMPPVNSPAVRRALNELRKVVNAVIRRHGAPDVIRVELARDMKRSRKQRQETWKRNNANRKRRDRAKGRLVEESLQYWAPGWEPKGSDVEKWLLAEECDFICPYTGRQMGFKSLFVEPEFDVEHIIPFSRCLNNSFLNKTLCCAKENRSVKHRRTPWEAYGGTEKWDKIIARVKKFKGDARDAKLRRFQVKDLADINEFADNQLNDTRYASRLAVRYLGLLYGAGATGVAPGGEHGKRVIQASRGEVTFYIRDVLGLNSILGDGGLKTRDDHRHHAVDALCVALTDHRTMQMLNTAAALAEEKRRRWFDSFEISEPWPGFIDDVREAVGGIAVSHRPSRKANTGLHEETNYSKIHIDPEGRECVHVRKKLEALSAGMVKNIVDPVVREKVEEKLGGGAPATVFKDAASLPHMTAAGGRKIPIRSVRIRVYDNIRKVGSGIRERNVITGSNHHVEIFEIKDAKGRPKWTGRVVSSLEAMDRVRCRVPIVDRNHPDGGAFVLSLSGGDIVELDTDDGRGLFRIRTISESKGSVNVEYAGNNDARMKKEIQAGKQWYKRSINKLRQLGCKKVDVTPAGDITYHND